MKTAMKIFTVVAAFASLFFLACNKENSTGSSGNSKLNIYLTDDPSLVFDNVWLDIQKVEIKLEDDSDHNESEHHNGNDDDDNDRHGSTSGGWIAIDIHPGIYDILRFRNGLDTLFGTSSFPSASNIRKLRITLGTSNTVVSGGVTAALTIHDNDNIIVLNIDESPVAINTGGLSNVWIDFDAGRSIRFQHNSFELKPSCKLFSREKTKSIEGVVLPKEAGAVVFAINGTDTASAKPENSGEFKFIGLTAGTYRLLYHATLGNYIDTSINNVVVSGNEDAHVVTVTLHQ